MFFSNSIANKKGFLPRPARFRAWTLWAGREAGSAQGDAIREIVANWSGIYSTTMATGASGAGRFSLTSPWHMVTESGEGYAQPDFAASRVVLTAEENRPVNVAVPMIIYIGNHI